MPPSLALALMSQARGQLWLTARAPRGVSVEAGPVGPGELPGPPRPGPQRSLPPPPVPCLSVSPGPPPPVSLSPPAPCRSVSVSASSEPVSLFLGVSPCSCLPVPPAVPGRRPPTLSFPCFASHVCPCPSSCLPFCLLPLCSLCLCLLVSPSLPLAPPRLPPRPAPP